MRCKFVAEVCSNHMGDMERCLDFVTEAAALGCWGVKFQHFKLDKLFSPEALKAHPKLWERKEWELPEEFTGVIALACQSYGVKFGSTPFYLEAVERLEPYVDFFKVSSYQILHKRLLARVAASGKPVVLSTGMATEGEIADALSLLMAAGCADLTLLHCVSSYPTKPEDTNLRAIQSLRERFRVKVGWSDHSNHPGVVERAVRQMKAEMVEFHLDLDGLGWEADAGHCWSPSEIKLLGKHMALPQDDFPWERPPLGDGCIGPENCEMEERDWRSDPEDGLRPLKAKRAELVRV